MTSRTFVLSLITVAFLVLALAPSARAYEPVLLNGVRYLKQTMPWTRFQERTSLASVKSAQSLQEWLQGLQKQAERGYYLHDAEVYDAMMALSLAMVPEWIETQESEVVRLLGYNRMRYEKNRSTLLPPGAPLHVLTFTQPVPLMFSNVNNGAPLSLHAGALLVQAEKPPASPLRFRMSEQEGGATLMRVSDEDPDGFIGLSVSLRDARNGNVDLLLSNLSSGAFSVYLLADHSVGLYYQKGVPVPRETGGGSPGVLGGHLDFGRGDVRRQKAVDLEFTSSRTAPGVVLKDIPRGASLWSIVEEHYGDLGTSDHLEAVRGVFAINEGREGIHSTSRIDAGASLILPRRGYLGLQPASRTAQSDIDYGDLSGQGPGVPSKSQ